MPALAPPLHSETLKHIRLDASIYIEQGMLIEMEGAAADDFYVAMMPSWLFASDVKFASVAYYVAHLNDARAVVTPQMMVGCARRRSAAVT